MSRPVFVVGCYRSGTTLVEHVLRAHGSAAGVGFETQFYTHILPGRRLPAFNRDRWQPILRTALGVDEWEAVAGPRLDAFRCAMAHSAAERPQWVEKTPEHVFHVERIWSDFPGAKIVCTLRDGRDVAASIAATSYLIPRVRGRWSRLVAACALWEWMTLEVLRLAERHRGDGGRFLLLPYEHLIARPREALAELARLLDWPDDAAAVKARLDGLAALESNTSFAPFSGLSSAPVGRWRIALSAREAALVNALLRSTLARAGYEPAPGGAELAGRAMRSAWLLARMAAFTARTRRLPPHAAVVLRRAIALPSRYPRLNR